VEELFEKFIRDKRYLKNLSSKTIDSYREFFGRWVGFVGKEMPNVDDNDDAGEHFKIKQVPGGTRVMRIFRDEDLRRLLDWRPSVKSRNEVRLHVLVYLLVDTGVRIDEALKLRIDGVDLESLLVKVRGKGNKERLVPISIEMRKVLYRYLGKHRHTVSPCVYLFCNSTGTPWSYVKYVDESSVSLRSSPTGWVSGPAGSGLFLHLSTAIAIRRRGPVRGGRKRIKKFLEAGKTSYPLCPTHCVSC